MKHFITGVTGQLGYDLYKELTNRNVSKENIIAPTSEELDITNRGLVMQIIEDTKPDVIYHCAAVTAAEKAEEEKDLCSLINYNGTQNIVDAAEKINAKVIFLSSDYVYSGDKVGEYVEEDETLPVNHYGITKVQAEKYVQKLDKYFIARVSWVFGINGHNFIKTMLRVSETKDEVTIVKDQVGSPTYTVDLAKVLIDMADSDKYGIYHITNEGFCSWAEFAEYIFESNKINIKINKVTSDMYPLKAKRPINSKLSKNKLNKEYGYNLPHWKDAVDRYNKELERVRKK